MTETLRLEFKGQVSVEMACSGTIYTSLWIVVPWKKVDHPAAHEAWFSENQGALGLPLAQADGKVK